MSYWGGGLPIGRQCAPVVESYRERPIVEIVEYVFASIQGYAHSQVFAVSFATALARLLIDFPAKRLLACAALCILCSISGLSGCASASSIPVVERVQPPTEKINTHWVSEGETLYAIAWRYNLDAERLAAANGLDQQNRIARGQVLRLDVNRALKERQYQPRPAATKPVRTAREIAVTRAPDKASSAPRVVTKPLPALAVWRWPTRGKLLKQFSFAGSEGHKGLDIGGATGQ